MGGDTCKQKALFRTSAGKKSMYRVGKQDVKGAGNCDLQENDAHSAQD